MANTPLKSLTFPGLGDTYTVAQPYTSNPAALGTVSAGSSGAFARGDHVHPKPTASDLGITVPSAATATPAMDGPAAVGSSAKYAKEDHVHPTDTSRLAANQGSGNAGKFLSIANDGTVTPADLPVYNGGVS